MVKKTTKKSVSSREAYDNLFIPLYSPKEKRKVLLSSLKNSLILQEEYEKLLSIRAKKKVILKEIKSNFNNLNKNYQDLKKLFPNIKSVLSYTEKELELLDMEIRALETSISREKEEVNLDKNIKKELIGREVKQNIEEDKKPTQKTKKRVTNKKKEPLTKVDRIKNNLKVIEEKLNKL